VNFKATKSPGHVIFTVSRVPFAQGMISLRIHASAVSELVSEQEEREAICVSSITTSFA